MWKIYYAGQGVTEDPNNPGASGHPSKVTELSGNLTACDAIQQCTNLCDTDLDIELSYSFDVHYLESTDQWECVRYYELNNGPSSQTYFDINNCDVREVYGYNVQS